MNTIASLFAILFNPMFFMCWLALAGKSLGMFNPIFLMVSFIVTIVWVPVFEWIRDDVLGGC